MNRSAYSVFANSDSFFEQTVWKLQDESLAQFLSDFSEVLVGRAQSRFAGLAKYRLNSVFLHRSHVYAFFRAEVVRILEEDERWEGEDSALFGDIERAVRKCTRPYLLQEAIREQFTPSQPRNDKWIYAIVRP